MKYSILLPYHNKPEINYTLSSFANLYGSRNDFEVIIVEDSKTDKERHDLLMQYIEQWKKSIQIRYFWLENFGYMGGTLLNYGALQAKGKYLILTSPECMHANNILEGLDQEFAEDENKYVVCACLCAEITEFDFDVSKVKYNPVDWYQHSVHKDRFLHFCSSISRWNFLGVGGIDEKYSDGLWYDDDDFLRKVRQVRFKIVARDDLLSLHIKHDSSYQDGSKIDTQNKIKKNLDYYKLKWY